MRFMTEQLKVKENIVELLDMPEDADIDFEPPKRNKEMYRPPEEL